MTIITSQLNIPVRPTNNLDILENPMEWLRTFNEGFMAHYETTGKFDWSRYVVPRNKMAPSGMGIILKQSRLLVISGAGIYHDEQPFSCNKKMGDYSIRLLPVDLPIQEFQLSGFSSTDPSSTTNMDMLLPMRHLTDMVHEGLIGSIAPILVSYCAYQPHAIRTVKELVPAVVDVVQKYQVQAVFMLPFGWLSTQTAGLLARALEVNGVSSVLICIDDDVVNQIAPPRYLMTGFEQGYPLDPSMDSAEQRRLVEAALYLLEQQAPVNQEYSYNE